MEKSVMKEEGCYKKAKFEDESFVDLVLSWCLDDILNEELYINQVEKIPDSFQSVDHYFGSFIFPLLEETRAELSSSLDVISRKPYAEITSLNVSKQNTTSLYNVQVEYWRRNRFSSHGKEPYRMLPGDVFVFTDAKLETISDLQPFERTWNLASLNEITEDNREDGSIATHFIVKTSQDIEVENLMRKPLFVIFLMNITTNKRIWDALHMLGNLTIIKEVSCTDSVGEEICSLCSGRSHRTRAEEFESTSSSILNESQAGAVLASLHKMQCEHKSFVELIWGPPGTGKTKTLSVLLCILLGMNCRTLVCAPTNIAITEVLLCVQKLVRESYEAGPVRNSSICSLGDILCVGNQDLLKVGSDIVPSVGSVEEFCLQKASLIFCTASNSYGLHSVAMKPLNFLVIDEAAQLKESELLIPLQLPDVRHVCLFGDECQLPAMINSNVST